MEQAERISTWGAFAAAKAVVRLDGRRNDEVVSAHSVTGAIKQAPASAEVRMDETHVLATARVSMGGPRKDEGSPIHVSVFLAPGSSPSEKVDNKDESEILLQNQLHTLLFGRPDGYPTDLEVCLSDDAGKVTFVVNVDCLIMHMESSSAVLDAMSLATKKALSSLDIAALNSAITSSAESDSFKGIDAAVYYEEVAGLPSIISTGQVGGQILLGCSKEEQDVASCKAHIALDTSMRLCGLRWSGMTDLSGLEQMLSASQHAVHSGAAV